MFISKTISLSKPSVITKPTLSEEEAHPPHGEAAVEKQSICEAMLRDNVISWDYLRNDLRFESELLDDSRFYFSKSLETVVIRASYTV